MREELDAIKSQLEEKKTAIANLKSQLEEFTHSETENTESPAVEPEPSTVNPEPSIGTTKPKLFTPGQLAKWINEKHHPEKPIKDYNVRDWFKKGSACSDEYRAKKQEEYGFKFSHCDKKGTLWFTVG